MEDYKKILFGTDFSENADVAFEHAINLAGKYKARLYIVHVINIAPMATYEPYMPVIDFSDFSRNVEARLQKDYIPRIPPSITAESKVLSGYPAVEMANFVDQEGVDLIVVGAHGESGLVYTLFGSVADRLVRKARCSVLVVRSFSATHNQE
ncbi:MAG: universal stress protein [Deltaproteobacteria bacterium]|jgi:nucleotide-binding universal stress UspA family protein|nr:MAG: universal stress protein [Deltaproteobacteria bacterium]